MTGALVLRYVVSLVLISVVAVPLLFAQSFTPVQFRVMGNASPGYIMIDSPLSDSAAFLDHSGNWLHRFAAKSLTNFQVQPDGTISAFVDDEKFVLWNSSFEKVAELSADGYPTDYHDVKVLPGNKYLVLGIEYRTVDLSTVVVGGRKDALVKGFVLQERTFSGQTLWSWKFLDHVSVEDATEDIDLTQRTVSPIHVNYIYVDTDGNIMLSCRHLDRIIKVNRQTGAIMWNLGGSKARKNDFTWVNDTRDGFTGFSHQHCMSRTASGDLILFDNANLNPRQVSRAVIYRMNEAARTIERIWQYEHPFEVFGGSMGSAVEQPNGNILISWGNNLAGALISEVTRSGELVMDLFSPTTNGFQSYRADKLLFRMAGAQRTVASPSTTEFVGSTGSTNLSLTATSVTRSTVVTVERHKSERPFGFLPNPEPCRYLPVRWCIRASDNEAIKGTLKLSLGAVPDLEDVTEVIVYHRAVEGAGMWNVVQGTFNETSKEFTTTAFATGEYVVGSRVCFVPRLLEPVFGQDRVAPNARLAWSTAKNTKGYQVQLATSTSFSPASIVLDVTTKDLQVATPLLESLTEYAWRVRALNDAGPGDWSQVGRFRTTVGRPVLVSPAFNGRDTISVPTDAALQWTPVNRANVYRVRIRQVGMPYADVFVDTTALTGSTVRGLKPNTWYTWQVQAANDTISGGWSDEALFFTSPAAPTGMLPQHRSSNLDHRYVRCTWLKSAAASRYEIRVAIAGQNTFIVNREVSDTTLLLPQLTPDVWYVWTVRSIGKFGRSVWSRELQFSTAPVTELGNALLQLPRPAEVVTTAFINLTWYLPSAQRFNLYLSRDSNGTDVIYNVEYTSDTNHTIQQGTLVNNAVYYWWVVAFDVPSGKTSTSERRSFEYRYAGPVVVGLRAVSPFNGQQNVPVEGALVWTKDSRVMSYRVQMFDDKGEMVLSMVVSDTVAEYVGLRRGAQYSWRVLGINADGVLDSGAVARFTTVPPVVNTIEEFADGTQQLSSYRVGNVLYFACTSTCSAISAAMYTLQGQLLTSGSADHSVALNIEDLQPGVYVVVARSGNNTTPLFYVFAR